MITIRILLIFAASLLLTSSSIDRSKKLVLKFKPYKKISYQYKQYVESTMSANDQLINSTDMVIEGIVEIIISDKDSAYVQFKPSNAWQISRDKKGKADSTQLELSISNFGQMRNDGTFDKAAPEANDFSILLFPLPSAPLNKGQMETTELPMTFSTFEAPVKLTAKKQVTLGKKIKSGRDRIYNSTVSIYCGAGDENKIEPGKPVIWYDMDGTYQFNDSRGYFEKGKIELRYGFIFESVEGSPFGKGKLKMTMKSAIDYKLLSAEKK